MCDILINKIESGKSAQTKYYIMTKNQFPRTKRQRKNKKRMALGLQNPERTQPTNQNSMNIQRQGSQYQQVTETQPIPQNHTFTPFNLTQGALERIAKWEAIFTQMFAEPQAPEQPQQVSEQPQQVPEQPQQVPEQLQQIPEQPQQVHEQRQQIPEQLQQVHEQRQQVHEQRQQKIPEWLQQVHEQRQQIPEWLQQALQLPQQAPKQPQQRLIQQPQPTYLRLWHYGDNDGKSREYKLFD